MVRTYILTDRERDIIKFFKETGRELSGYRELKHLITNLDLDRLIEDLETIKQFRKQYDPVV